jgi:nitrate reductase delta subunit
MPTATLSTYEKLAPLFEYPGAGYYEAAAEAAQCVASQNTEAAALLSEFCAAIKGLSTDDLDELFTRTFDLNPLCTLELGWQLYGEDYQRGEFLVKMRGQLREHNIPESTELPDHMTHVLALLAQMPAEEAATFCSQVLLPALDKMTQGWQTNHNAFWSLLLATFTLLKSCYTYTPLRNLRNAPELTVLQ